MKTYLVTGAAGFIGANFLKYILKKHEDINVIVVDTLTYAGNLGTIKEELKDSRVKFEKVDIRDRKEIERIFTENKVDYVVNFAAESHVDRSIENPQIFLETNILGTQNLLDNAKKSWAISKDENGYPVYREGIKYLQVSTDEVYGSLSKDYDEAIELVIDDKDVKKVVKNRKNLKTYGNKFFTEESPADPRSPYSASKTGADHIVIAYGETYKLPINITRCSNNYGPYHFPEKLIPLMIKNILEGKKLPVYGKGDNVRDWLYVEDHCKGIDLVLREAKVGEIYNIGGFNEEKNISIVKLVIDILKEEITNNNEYKKVLKTDISNVSYDLITYVQDRLGHDMRYAIDPSKIAKDLGWYPETDFETEQICCIIYKIKNLEERMGKPLIINKRVKISEKAQKKINKLSEYRENSIEFKLLTNIIFSIERLEKDETNLLDIKLIKGTKNKLLKEIRIKHPLNYRIFFTEINNNIHILDIREKKTDRFPQSYFDILLNMIKRILNAVLLILFIL